MADLKAAARNALASRAFGLPNRASVPVMIMPRRQLPKAGVRALHVGNIFPRSAEMYHAKANRILGK